MVRDIFLFSTKKAAFPVKRIQTTAWAKRYEPVWPWSQAAVGMGPNVMKVYFWKGISEMDEGLLYS